ncbi:hypothetical protein A2U01_0101700, partial [Trifolium medium]|nr:hypothetical protein [Trifolium medium]
GLVWIEKDRLHDVIIEVDAQAIAKAIHSRLYSRNQWEDYRDSVQKRYCGGPEHDRYERPPVRP